MNMPLPMRACRIDVDAERGGDDALQAQGEIAPARLEKPVGQAIGLKRMEAFEIEERLHHPQACGIAVGDRHEVGVERLADRRLARDRLLEGLADQRGRKVAMVEPRGDAVRHRRFERVMVENVDGKKERQLRLAPRRLFGLLPDSRE